jgi:hypothetical protein
MRSYSLAGEFPFWCLSLILLLTATKSAAALDVPGIVNVQRQQELSSIITETLGNRSRTMGAFRTGRSPFHTGLSVFENTHCDKNIGSLSQVDSDRVGCCQPDNARLLYNVKIEKEKFVVYTISKGSNLHYKLPPVDSMAHQRRSSFEMMVGVEFSTGERAVIIAVLLK